MKKVLVLLCLVLIFMLGGCAPAEDNNSVVTEKPTSSMEALDIPTATPTPIGGEVAEVSEAPKPTILIEELKPEDFATPTPTPIETYFLKPDKGFRGTMEKFMEHMKPKAELAVELVKRVDKEIKAEASLITEAPTEEEGESTETVEEQEPITVAQRFAGYTEEAEDSAVVKALCTAYDLYLKQGKYSTVDMEELIYDYLYGAYTYNYVSDEWKDTLASISLILSLNTANISSVIGDDVEPFIEAVCVGVAENFPLDINKVSNPTTAKAEFVNFVRMVLIAEFEGISDTDLTYLTHGAFYVWAKNHHGYTYILKTK